METKKKQSRLEEFGGKFPKWCAAVCQAECGQISAARRVSEDALLSSSGAGFKETADQREKERQREVDI